MGGWPGSGAQASPSRCFSQFGARATRSRGVSGGSSAVARIGGARGRERVREGRAAPPDRQLTSRRGSVVPSIGRSVGQSSQASAERSGTGCARSEGLDARLVLP